MKTEYKKNISGVCLVLEEDKVYQEDYQIQMIAANEIFGLLPLKAQGINGGSRYSYTINGKVNMKAMYEKLKIGKQDLLLFLNQFLHTSRAVYDHMLNINSILLDPEYIFFEEGQFYFCYYPLGNEELFVQFHHLTEYIVRQVDYEDKSVIRMAYELHKKTMEENYSIEHVIAQVSHEQEAEEEDETEPEEDELWNPEKVYEQRPEKENPIHKIFKRKKMKWGDWDDLP